jgi:hypothetical protein
MQGEVSADCRRRAVTSLANSDTIECGLARGEVELDASAGGAFSPASGERRHVHGIDMHQKT